MEGSCSKIWYTIATFVWSIWGKPWKIQSKELLFGLRFESETCKFEAGNLWWRQEQKQQSFYHTGRVETENTELQSGKWVCTCTEKAVEKITLNKELQQIDFLLSVWLNTENRDCPVKRSHEENNLWLSKRSPGTAIHSYISEDNIRTTSLSWRPRELCWWESKLLVGPSMPDRSNGRGQKKCGP
jgi:hypothetical protein